MEWMGKKYRSRSGRNIMISFQKKKKKVVEELWENFIVKFLCILKVPCIGSLFLSSHIVWNNFFY